MPTSRFPALSLVLLLAASASTSGAQTPRPALTDATALLQRCTSVPDEEACRAVLRLAISDSRRSLALTYLAEAGGEPRDSLLEEAVKRDSSNALAHALLGMGASRHGPPAWVSHLTRAVALRPDWTHLHARIAATYIPQDRAQLDTSVVLWRRAVAAAPAESRNHAGLAVALMRVGGLAEAEASFRRAASMEPDLPSATGGLCEALLRQRKLVEAQAPCARAIAGWNGQHGVDLRQIEYYAEQEKDYRLALSAAEQGLAEDPRSSYYRSDRTRILQLMGREAEAERLLRAYVAEHPSDWNAVEELADYLYWRNDLRPARELYLRLVDPTCGSPHTVCTMKGNLSIASLRLNMVDDAFRHLAAAFEHQSDCPGLLEQFRAHAVQRSDSAAVLARVRRTLAELGTRAAARRFDHDAAQLFAATGDWTRAALHFRLALDSALARERGPAPDRFSAILRWQYGRALVEQGRYCDGLRELNAARATAPDFANGRPDLERALVRAREGCRESVR